MNIDKTEQGKNRSTLALESLWKFAHQRPGLEFGNYGDMKLYNQEMRGITKQLARFKAIYREAVAYGVTDGDLDLANKGDRLTWNETSKEWDYCAGQYFPCEYRNAAANKLERAVSSAKARRFEPMPEREYSLAEMRQIAERSGSHFF